MYTRLFKRSMNLVTGLIHNSARSHLGSQNYIEYRPTVYMNANVSQPAALDSRDAPISTLKNNLHNGLKYYSNRNLPKALESLNKAIQFLDRKNVDDLSPEEKIDIAYALTSKARIISLFSEEDEKEALNLLSLATQLCPECKESENLRESIRKDAGLPRMRP